MPDEPNRTHKEGLIEDAAEIARDVARGASPLTKGLALIMGITGVLIAANSDTIIKLFQITHDVEHLQAAHDRCHIEMDALKADGAILRTRVAANEQEINRLKERLADN